jgi:hypothetical protein
LPFRAAVDMDHLTQNPCTKYFRENPDEKYLTENPYETI